MITIILVETSLELMPVEICHVKAIKREAAKKNKKTRHIILDAARHRPFMVNFKLKNKDKRGRPDILHRFLLLSLGSLASKKEKLQLYVHTMFDRVFKAENDVRFPRNYNRFIGLLEQLLVKGQVPPKGEALIQIKKQTLEALLKEIQPKKVILLSKKGTPVKIKEYLKTLDDLSEENYVFLIGGFSFGELTPETKKVANEIISLDEEVLSSTVVGAKLIMNYENLIL